MRVRVRSFDDLFGHRLAAAFAGAGSRGVSAAEVVALGGAASLSGSPERLVEAGVAYLNEATNSYLLRKNLRPGSVHEVLCIEDGWYRLLAPSPGGALEPFLFASERFEVVDNKHPDFWVSRTGPEQELHTGPAAWLDQEFFFERFHDQEEFAVREFWSVLEARYPAEWSRASR